ncbi:MAG: TolB family protein [Nocardioidaceae bacterium]
MQDSTLRVSVSSSGLQAHGSSFDPALSANGRYVAFYSAASNLVAGDTNGVFDVFVRDRTNGVTRRVSVSSSGLQANRGSLDPSISADGRYVAFSSQSSRLVAGDTNGRTDVFVRDRMNHVTRRVSVSSNGSQVRKGSFVPSISADGRYVAFFSRASHLVAGDTNSADDVFVRDRKNHITRRVSVSSSGLQSNARSDDPSISAHGRYVAFTSLASNLVAGDTNGSYDVFVRDRKNHVSSQVSVSLSGLPADGFSSEPSVSSGGRYVAFTSFASNLVAEDTNGSYDVFVRDRVNGVTSLVSVSSDGLQANLKSGNPSISAHGRYVAFYSYASNLVAEDTNGTYDVFVRDGANGATSLASVSSAGLAADGLSGEPSISADGRSLAFTSEASNLVAGDTNSAYDVFVRDPWN